MSGALVVAGVVVLAFSCLGVLLMRGALARLHYVSVSTLGAVLVVAGVLVRDGASLIGVKAVLVGAFLVATGPVLGHATARAIYTRSRGRR
ncbi:MAG TPA: monovalent cation/H(+) antiporter subunit G [Solirubrobacteraceae bacterium]|nr:monovalent cation/H(+) antiporter subunit G [Solirubrobacteraceae bacterium]